jgi:hypothetical protein
MNRRRDAYFLGPANPMTAEERECVSRKDFSLVSPGTAKRKFWRKLKTCGAESAADKDQSPAYR